MRVLSLASCASRSLALLVSMPSCVSSPERRAWTPLAALPMRLAMSLAALSTVARAAVEVGLAASVCSESVKRLNTPSSAEASPGRP